MFTIGEFSKATGLTIKALRFYHDQGLLIPAHIDPQTGYRYYDEEQIEPARAIAFLRRLEFPVAEIKTLFEKKGLDEQILDAIERQKAALAERVARFRKVIRLLDNFIAEERRVRLMAESTFEAQEKDLDSLLIAGIRMKGRYRDCGPAFAKIGRALGRLIHGKPLLLHYDAEYKEEDADFEACLPVRRRAAIDGVLLRELPAVHCVSLVHKGPYEQLGRSYAKALKFVKERGYAIVMPTREVYIKGPGMFFAGNPKNYITEIQIPVAPGGEAGRGA